jgi:uncharacterized protein YbgA (DUF1722 family)/uncharacterized protein YbbK (DUF523 family)
VPLSPGGGAAPAPRLGISSCLLGNAVRFDGGHKLDHSLRDTLGRFVTWVPVCPEVEYGLPVPREALRLVGDPAAPRLVTRRSGVDHTDGMRAYALRRVEELAREELCGFVFKSRSPSSGMRQVKVYGASGVPATTGVGIFARAFLDRFPLVPAEDDGRLQDPLIRESFIERVFAFARWRELVRGGGSAGAVVAFHTEHKLTLLAHSPRHYAALGRVVAEAGRLAREELHRRYLSTFMEGMRLVATTRKNTNVLQHAAGYFKRALGPAEKAELAEVIESYRLGHLPLIVPITLLAHHVRVHGEPYLARQRYLHPAPRELQLRNHA